MNEFFNYFGNYFPYLAAVVTSILALRISWEAFRSGASPMGAISRGVGMFITFFIVVNFLPFLFEFGVSSSYARYQNGTVGKNLIAITEGGVNLLMTAQTNGTALEVPEITPVAAFAADTVQKLTGGNEQSAAAEPQAQQMSVSRSPGEPQVQIAPVKPAVVYGPQPKPTVVYGPQPKPTVVYGPQPKPAADGYLPSFTQPVPTKPAGGGYLPAINDGGGATTYTVQRGDYAGKIATSHGVSTVALCTANGLSMNGSCNQLRVGQQLVIP